MIERGNVAHDSRNIYYRSTVGAAEAGSKLQLGLWMRSRKHVEKALLHLWHERLGEKLVTLLPDTDDKEKECLFRATIQLPEKGCLIWYYFIIASPEGTQFYGNNEEQLGGLGDLYDHVPPAFQITVFNKGARTPDWFKRSVLYQIFPDRFHRAGNESIDKKGALVHAHWQDPPCQIKDPDTKAVMAYDFFGGNLKGIEQKLDYLEELGISAIYLNPVFESESNHHYDTGDYHKIDPLLGTNEDFRRLAASARKRGIRIILDGVFSHTGSNSRYFNRNHTYDSLGAYESKDSPYYEWYKFRSYPNDYEAWWNQDNMPNVAETTPTYMDFIIRGKDSVMHHWMKEGASGWRLDVMDELPPEFSQCFYREMKKTDPDAVLIGEVWEDASNKVSYGTPREYLCGQEMDSAMNYPFRAHVMDFLLGATDAQTCLRRMESLRENYPKENFYAMMNLIGSHDVMRAVSVLGEAPYYDGMPAAEQAKYRLDAEHYALGVARLRLAALWQMTYPGVPSIYYGDEIAMEGLKNPYNRGTYDWENGNSDLRAWYRALIRERKEHTALCTGELLPLQAHGDVLAYARLIRDGKDAFGQKAENELYVIAFNRSPTESRWASPEVGDLANGVFVSAFDGTKRYPVRRGRVSLELPPLSGALLRYEALPQVYDRKAGILLHPTSLPSKYGIGDLGREAFQFLDYLKEAGQSIWQILPLGPVGYGYSPYQSPSAFAGNPLLISVDGLIDEGWLKASDARLPYKDDGDTVDFDRAKAFKMSCLKKAYAAFRKTAKENKDYQEFCQQEAWWLEDYARFMAIRSEYGEKSWTEWPETVKHRKPAALKRICERLADSIEQEKFQQYVFARQWQRLHAYAKEHGIQIMGDMPIFISADSADAWAHQKLFRLNEDGTPKTVAGVPPDYFSATGQLWGNPQYDWEAMEDEDYAWWKSRFRKLYQMVDIVRIDHFRGFESYWEIDGKEETAINGKWVKGPGKPFFDAIRKELGDLPIVAEDLGIITDEVEELRAACGFPGMKVLHFTLYFNEGGRMGFVSPENSIVYTGTHDNNTTAGWYKNDLDSPSRLAIARLIGADPEDPKDVCRHLVEFAYASDARMAIVPMQDLLELDESCRMNLPGTVGGNWAWRLRPTYRMKSNPKRIRELCTQYKR